MNAFFHGSYVLEMSVREIRTAKHQIQLEKRKIETQNRKSDTRNHKRGYKTVR